MYTESEAVQLWCEWHGLLSTGMCVFVSDSSLHRNMINVHVALDSKMDSMAVQIEVTHQKIRCVPDLDLQIKVTQIWYEKIGSDVTCAFHTYGKKKNLGQIWGKKRIWATWDCSVNIVFIIAHSGPSIASGKIKMRQPVVWNHHMSTTTLTLLVAQYRKNDNTLTSLMERDTKLADKCDNNSRKRRPKLLQSTIKKNSKGKKFCRKGKQQSQNQEVNLANYKHFGFISNNTEFDKPQRC